MSKVISTYEDLANTLRKFIDFGEDPFIGESNRVHIELCAIGQRI